VTDEVVLVAANEKVAQRFWIGLNFYVLRLGDRAGAVAEV